MSINPDTITPTVNLTGNSKESLLTQWHTFYEKLDAVVDHFPHESFHARNHFVRGESARKDSRTSQGELQRQIISIKNLAETVIEKIQEQ
jgi:hypothetical protein